MPYSAINNTAKKTDEYSTLYPATNSASASTKSKGVLFVSAKEVIKNKTHTGNNGKKNQTSNWLCTISTNENEPAINITEAITVPIQISYEIIWEAARIPPKKAYLELLDQPAKRTDWTLKVPTIKKINKTYSNSTKAKRFDPGIKHQNKRVKNKVNNGAAMKRTAFALEVENNSFKTSLRPSAIGWNIPKVPCSFGPRLRWILPKARRSMSVITAIDNNNGTTSEINKQANCNIFKITKLYAASVSVKKNIYKIREEYLLCMPESQAFRNNKK